MTYFTVNNDSLSDHNSQCISEHTTIKSNQIKHSEPC